MSERRYWIGVVSQDHVEAAVAHGFVQLNHGKAGPLERMRPGDGFAFYSPRADLSGRRAAAGVHGDRPRGRRSDLRGRGDRPGTGVSAQRPVLRRDAGADQAAARAALVHPQQGALGRGVPLRRRARAARGLRGDRGGDGSRSRRRFRLMRVPPRRSAVADAGGVATARVRRSPPCRLRYDAGARPRARQHDEADLSRFRAADRRAAAEDRRAALRARGLRRRHLRRDHAPHQEEPAAHQGHLQQAVGVADRPGRAPSAAPVHARLHQRDVRRLPRAARRSHVTPTIPRSSAGSRASTAFRAW